LYYWLSLPAQGSLTPGESPPLILYLYGFNHSGSHLVLVLGGGAALQIKLGRDLPALVVSPQCPSGENWQSADMVERLSKLVDEVVTQYGADPQRVYLTGFSMGGDGAWALGIAHPEQFAALAPVGSWYWKPDRVCALKETPVWVFQGEKDEIVAPRFAQDMVSALEKCGGNVKLTLFPKAGHEETSTLAYGMDELYTWSLDQVRR
jgi:predicted peptidase